ASEDLRAHHAQRHGDHADDDGADHAGSLWSQGADEPLQRLLEVRRLLARPRHRTVAGTAARRWRVGPRIGLHRGGGVGPGVLCLLNLAHAASAALSWDSTISW